MTFKRILQLGFKKSSLKKHGRIKPQQLQDKICY